ncbi:MAG: type II toxin-antitoxin system VapB family antitoxin [Kiritimatiellae bacterium]|nr:type II toxin-antitoxin system VapB family antitoxin [Kiritimatiellia bacterium]
MRTNIVLDDELLAAAMKYSGARSKRAVVQEALATYVSVKARQQKLESYRDRLAGVRRRLAEAPIKTSSRELIRADRDRAS